MPDETPPAETAAFRPPAQRPGGRSARIRAAVLDATMAALAEGDEACTVAQIATRAGVHESSLYRRWGTREALIADAVTSQMGEAISLPDTGSLRGDLLALLGSSIAFHTSPYGAQLVQATVPASRIAANDQRSAYWPQRLARLGVIFDRARERGELAPDADTALALELLTAPLYFRVLITNAPLDDALPERLTTFILRAIGADTTS